MHAKLLWFCIYTDYDIMFVKSDLKMVLKVDKTFV